MAYKLELPPSSHVYPVFHVSCLKKVIDDKFQIQTFLLEVNEKGKIKIELEIILETRTKQLINGEIIE